jgi:DNA-binding NarL/FixJ family response regulator
MGGNMNAAGFPQLESLDDVARPTLRGKRVFPRAAARAKANPLRILVAHQHDLIRRGVRALFEAHRSWEICDEARTSSETVVKAERSTPDIAIVDLTIPQLCGTETARQIRTVSPKTEILVIAEHFTDELIPHIVRAGVRGYILKTDPEHDFVTAIKSLAHHVPFFTARAVEMLMGSNGISDNPRFLSSRERDVVRSISEGNRTRTTATVLGITSNTVETHRANIMRKLELHSTADLVRYAIRNRIIEA